MSGLLAAAVAGVGWCFCTASASLCSSWCGNDKPSTIPPSATSGRKRSVLLLASSIVVALVYQYGLAPNYDKIGWQYLSDAWSSGCDAVEGNEELVQVCAGNAAVYRASSAAFVFFVIFGIAAKCKPTSNREAWPAKYVLFLFLCIGTIFIPNDPVFIPIYLWVARVGSVVFILLQQVILVDIAYNWNLAWLDKSDQAELTEGRGKGKKWLAAILVSCGILYIASLAGIIIMYTQFKGCATNDAFISITLAMSCLCTLIQLLISEKGSLLTSACLTLYATYLCGTAVSKNPNAECNPKLGETSTWSIVLGLLVAFISLMWAGWSYTSDNRLGQSQSATPDNDDSDEEKPKAGGVVVNDGTTYGAADSQPPESSNQESNSINPAPSQGSWKLNAVMCLICCWYAMTLTGWGAIEKRGNIANPDVGEVSMWMLIVGQWVALLLYLWTLVAPSLFPDRDFS